MDFITILSSDKTRKQSLLAALKKEDKEEIQDASANLAAAEETSVIAAVALFLSESDFIFTLKDKKQQ